MNTADSDIKVQEKRRVDLVYNLVDCVKQYDKHEADTLTAIVEGRGSTGDIENVTTAIAAVSEAYPELKSNENYKELMNELSITENLIAEYRSNYNKQIKVYRRYVRKFPTRIFEVSYLKHIFSSKKIQLPDDDYIDTLKESSHVRFKYYGVGLKYTGTIFTELKNKTIKNNSPFYENMTIDETVDHLESDFALWLFWIFWIILIGACVYGFYYLDNEWLE